MAVSMASIGVHSERADAAVAGEAKRLFENVVVGVDGQQGGRDAIALARTLAVPEARLRLANFYVPTVSVRGIAGKPTFVTRAESSRAMLVRECRRAGFDAEVVSMAGHAIGSDLQELARHTGADLIVVGSCRRGLVGRVFLGDDTRATLNGATCAIAIAPSGYRPPPRLTEIGIGYDGSPESVQALAAARELAKQHRARVRALTVVSARDIMYNDSDTDWHVSASRLIEEERRRLEEIGDVAPIAAYGEPSDELMHFSDELDLLVLGSRNHGPVDRLFEGSTSNHLARRTHCPLLVLPRGVKVLSQE